MIQNRVVFKATELKTTWVSRPIGKFNWACFIFGSTDMPRSGFEQDRITSGVEELHAIRGRLWGFFAKEKRVLAVS